MLERLKKGRDESGGKRDEDEEERLDRELGELLQELRVALPGIQVLFAFLLILPFSQGFADVTPFQEKVYFGTLLSTALASMMLIAPSARHRIQFRRFDKRYIVLSGNRLAIGGISLLAVSISGVILLVTDFLFGSPEGAIATTLIALTFAWAWFVSPLTRRVAADEGED